MICRDSTCERTEGTVCLGCEVVPRFATITQAIAHDRCKSSNKYLSEDDVDQPLVRISEPYFSLAAANPLHFCSTIHTSAPTGGIVKSITSPGSLYGFLMKQVGADNVMIRYVHIHLSTKTKFVLVRPLRSRVGWAMLVQVCWDEATTQYCCTLVVVVLFADCTSTTELFQ